MLLMNCEKSLLNIRSYYVHHLLLLLVHRRLFHITICPIRIPYFPSTSIILIQQRCMDHHCTIFTHTQPICNKPKLTILCSHIFFRSRIHTTNFSQQEQKFSIMTKQYYNQSNFKKQINTNYSVFMLKEHCKYHLHEGKTNT